MLPDDPRHGTQAGSVAHWRLGEQPCDPCRIAGNRACKAARIDRERGRPRTVTLGKHAHQVILRVPADQLARSTGIMVHKLSRLKSAGPDQDVHRTTRDRILRAGAEDHWTVIGIQRRVRALVALGWSTRAIAEHTVCEYEAVKRLARSEERSFIRRAVAEDVLDVYERLSVAPTVGASATRARNDAARHGWALPGAWLDIDDPAERPDPGYADRSDHARRLADDLDPVVVDRILGGDFTLAATATKPERIAVVARWTGTSNELERRTGWNLPRYKTEGAA